jgi:SAM-dependent methyltransferase
MDYQDYILQKNKDVSHFWFAAKLNLIENLLEEVFFNEKSDKSILDIGCGTGTELDILNKFGQVTALDTNQTALDLIKQKGSSVILADIEKFILPKNSYDAVCCFDLLEHLANDEKVLKNIFQSLKNNGYLLFTVPAFKFIFSTHDLALKHQRRYNKKDIDNKLKSSGFTIISLGYWNTVLFPIEVVARLFKKLLYIKLFKQPGYQSDAKSINPLVNKFLFSILNLENKLINYGIKFPFGLSLYGIAQKNVS